LPKGPDPDVSVIGQRLSKVKQKILILSGKGGVGKIPYRRHDTRHNDAQYQGFNEALSHSKLLGCQ
jgi:hypothetical protein